MRAHLHLQPLLEEAVRPRGSRSLARRADDKAPERADCTQFEAVMDYIRVPRLGPGRPRRRPDRVGADKVYSNRRTRTSLRERGIRHVIPEKRDQAAGRLRRDPAADGLPARQGPLQEAQHRRARD
ncbi:hypothetical protein GCM10010302_06580 [Streptomyces polychromogenes]|uniref:Transposase n=1 Tax=Streptomyces polychromogenes TaxID=67342 RepID=A0ABN0V284_9ACTN